jgi:hypothetical protein
VSIVGETIDALKARFHRDNWETRMRAGPLPKSEGGTYIMRSYSQSSLGERKGSASGVGRDYAGRFSMTYLETLEDRLEQATRTRNWYQSEFNQAKARKDALRVGEMAIHLHRIQKSIGHLELLIETERRAAGKEVVG